MKKIECNQCQKNQEIRSAYDTPKGWFTLMGGDYKERHLCSVNCLTSFAEAMVVDAPRDEPLPSASEPTLDELLHV